MKEDDPMTLMEFSIIPLDKGASLSQYIAKVLTVVDESGLDYRLNPMGTVVEGEWDDLLDLLTKCFRTLEMESDRISLQAKFDCRKGVSGALEGKIKSVEARAERSFRK
jgi:uncharacterized protein (TIGR00106 family)